jgi:hypothetical protein
LSGVAPEALQQGVAVARNITRQLRRQSPQPFRYFNKGRLAIIGCHAGVGQILGWTFTGFLAWIMWLGVHLVYLPGFRNRLFVLLTWLQTYLFGDCCRSDASTRRFPPSCVRQDRRQAVRVVRSILPLSNRIDTGSQAVVDRQIRVSVSE